MDGDDPRDDLDGPGLDGPDPEGDLGELDVACFHPWATLAFTAGPGLHCRACNTSWTEIPGDDTLDALLVVWQSARDGIEELDARLTALEHLTERSSDAAPCVVCPTWTDDTNGFWVEPLGWICQVHAPVALTLPDELDQESDPFDSDPFDGGLFAGGVPRSRAAYPEATACDVADAATAWVKRRGLAAATDLADAALFATLEVSAPEFCTQFAPAPLSTRHVELPSWLAEYLGVDVTVPVAAAAAALLVVSGSEAVADPSPAVHAFALRLLAAVDAAASGALPTDRGYSDRDPDERLALEAADAAQLPLYASRLQLASELLGVELPDDRGTVDGYLHVFASRLTADLLASET